MIASHAPHLWTALQPIVDLHTGAVIAHEALLRSRSQPTAPDALFQAAIQTGQLAELEAAARRLALARIVDLPAPHKLAINIATECLEVPLPRAVDPSRIILEISERHAVVDNHPLIRLVDTWRRDGYTIALDDYGVGYMGLGAILMLKPHIIKWDRMLIQGIDHDAPRQTLLRTAQQMTAALGIIPIAEGIETPEELAFLRDAGIPYGQGFVLGRPQEHPRLHPIALPAPVALN